MPPIYDPPSSGRTRIKGTDPRVRAVTDRIGRGTMANTPSETGEASTAGKLKRTSIRGHGQVKQAWDDDGKSHYYHYSPEENFEGIQRRGLDPEFKGRHGEMAKGVHFSDTTDTYRPIGDDRGWNVYRVRRDAFDSPRPEAMEGGPYKEHGVHMPEDYQRPMYQRATDDFYTPKRVAPADIEVYTETGGLPRWSGLENAYSKGSGALGLYNMLAAFLPTKLPSIQTPADWVIGYNLTHLDQSPWNPKYTTPVLA